jgi:hypothetical protein
MQLYPSSKCWIDRSIANHASLGPIFGSNDDSSFEQTAIRAHGGHRTGRLEFVVPPGKLPLVHAIKAGNVLDDGKKCKW